MEPDVNHNLFSWRKSKSGPVVGLWCGMGWSVHLHLLSMLSVVQEGLSLLCRTGRMRTQLQGRCSRQLQTAVFLLSHL